MRAKVGDTRHCWGALGPHLIPGALPTLGGLGDTWAFWGLSLTATLACISAAILGRREQSFNEHLLCAIHHFTVPAVACEAGVIIQRRHLARALSRPSAGADSNPDPPDFRALALSSLSPGGTPTGPRPGPSHLLGGSSEHSQL